VHQGTAEEDLRAVVPLLREHLEQRERLRVLLRLVELRRVVEAYRLSFVGPGRGRREYGGRYQRRISPGPTAALLVRPL
jgi:hypothetical protein